ncbi:MAG: hypothetical protein IKS67_04015 [Victivallales bacterium]|nr:hypothetical protein [Victivallales bacterium]
MEKYRLERRRIGENNNKIWLKNCLSQARRCILLKVARASRLRPTASAVFTEHEEACASRLRQFIGERFRGTNMTHEELLKKVAEAKKRLEHLRGFL